MQKVQGMISEKSIPNWVGFSSRSLLLKKGVDRTASPNNSRLKDVYMIGNTRAYHSTFPKPY